MANNAIFANTGTETTRNWGVQLGPNPEGMYRNR